MAFAVALPAPASRLASAGIEPTGFWWPLRQVPGMRSHRLPWQTRADWNDASAFSL
ncbi:MAG: hypothetical protein KatS3mg132_862 [Limisphaera sp.]|nr:MAG: hypothetical protein KatS3mg132_862 [Limisphaera sp.]